MSGNADLDESQAWRIALTYALGDFTFQNREPSRWECAPGPIPMYCEFCQYPKL